MIGSGRMFVWHEPNVDTGGEFAAAPTTGGKKGYAPPKASIQPASGRISWEHRANFEFATSITVVGVDGPRRHRVCQNGVVVADLRQRRPSVPGTDYPNRNGYVEARFPASWRECRRGITPGILMLSKCEAAATGPAGAGAIGSTRSIGEVDHEVRSVRRMLHHRPDSGRGADRAADAADDSGRVPGGLGVAPGRCGAVRRGRGGGARPPIGQGRGGAADAGRAAGLPDGRRSDAG